MPEPRPIREGLFVDDAGGPHLLAARCAACARLHFPAGDTCPYCAADGCATVPVGPTGRLRLFTAVLTRPPAYRGPVPYGFGVVELGDGLCVITRLAEHRGDRLRPGLPVRLVLDTLHEDDDGRPVVSYAFAPEDG